jgi:N-dimethylarginine dimethylaminohydrolase
MAGATFGGQSEFARLRRVVVRTPDQAFGDADPAQWHYTGRPDLGLARAEHAALVQLLTEAGVEVIHHTSPLNLADAIYVYDPVLIADRGAILLRMGKALRRGEEAALGQVLTGAGVPILGRLRSDAMAEAGDTLWLDPETLAVGVGFRTNAEGVEQLRALLPDVRVVPVDLPYHHGPDACLHLKSLISIVGDRLAVVHLELLPVALHRELAGRGFELLEIPPAEFATQACNVLALDSRDCVALEGNPETRRRMEAAGCRVRVYRGAEISLKAEGGPTCLTRPVLRG